MWEKIQLANANIKTHENPYELKSVILVSVVELTLSRSQITATPEWKGDPYSSPVKNSVLFSQFTTL